MNYKSYLIAIVFCVFNAGACFAEGFVFPHFLSFISCLGWANITAAAILARRFLLVIKDRS